MSKEAMKLALEALEVATTPFARDRQEVLRAQAALREALAKPDFWEGYVPEPVKPATEESSATQAQQALDKKAENARELGLDYEPAQPYKGIADHINQATNGGMRIDPVTGDVGIGTPSTPAQQEPVAWKLVPTEPTEEMLKAMDECSKEGYDERLYAGHAASVYMAAVDVAPIPPQRTWVELTDEEIKALASWWPSYDQIPALMVLAKDIQNSLKEKNT